MFLILTLKNPDFFKCKVKIPYKLFLIFLFHQHIFRSSRSQTFFKIGALKNVAIFWIKKRLQRRCFRVNITKFLRTAFLNRACQVAASKVYSVLIIFSSQHVLDVVWCIKCQNLFVYKCRHLSGFLNNSVRVYPTKLKIGMLYHMSNSFRNTVF